MIEQIHQHIIEELKTNTKTDIIFILTAIFINFLSLAINTGIAASGSQSTHVVNILIFVALVIVINTVVEVGLMKGLQTRAKLIKGLIEMYKDKGVDRYYDPSLLLNYKTRYVLFMVAVICTGLVAIIVPFVMLGK
jgi:hypothetical protein